VSGGRGRCGRLLGYAIVRFRRATSVARLYSIAVAEGARGHGVGEQLLTAAEDEARRRGDLFMRLEVRADNAAAIALYHRLGYKAFGRHLDYYEDHTPKPSGWRKGSSAVPRRMPARCPITPRPPISPAGRPP
jgi:ribosomal protein S18 acetylase RimI-like enzyme